MKIYGKKKKPQIKIDNGLFRHGHTDNRFGSGSDFLDFGYFETREIGTDRII